MAPFGGTEAGVHARSHRRRNSDRRRSDPGRHERLHHDQWPVEPAPQARASAIPAPGPWMPLASRATIRPFCSPTRRERCCPRAARIMAIRAMAWPSTVEALTQALPGSRPGRPTDGLGRRCVCAGDGSRRLRRRRCLCEGDRLDGPALPGQQPGPGRRGVRLPGQKGLERRRQGLAKGLALYPGIMAGLARAGPRSCRRHALAHRRLI